MCRNYSLAPRRKQPEEDPQESKLDAREAVSAIIGDPTTLTEDLETHLDKLRQLGYSEALIEDFRLRLNVGEGEPS